MAGKEINMTEGSPVRRITAFAMPVIAAGLVQQLYQLGDTLIAGRFIGSGALAAVSNSSMCIFFVTILFSGIGNGASIVLSQFYGRGDTEKVRTVVDTSALFFYFGGIFCTFAGLLLSAPLLRIIAVPPEIFDETLLYLRILFGGIAPVFGYAVVTGMLNAVGDSRTPLEMLAASTLLNLGLDLLFVTRFGMGVAGLAVATVIAQTIAFAGCIIYVNSRKGVVRLRLRGLRFSIAMLRRIVRMGLPTGIQDALMIISVMVLQNRINAFGVAVVAGRSIVGRIEGFLLLPIHGLGAAIMTYTAQNFGAGKSERIYKGLRIGFIMMTLLSAGLAAAVLASKGLLLPLFSSSAETLAAAEGSIWITVPCYSFYALAVVWQSFFRGCGDTWFPLVVSLVTQFAFRIATIDLFLRFIPDPTGIWYAYAASWLLMFALDSAYYHSGLWKRVQLRLHGRNKISV